MTFYAAINANAAHPQEAFDFIELLYSPELVTQQGIEVNGMHYGTMFDYGDNGSLAIPVKDGVLLQYAEDSGLLPGTWPPSKGLRPHRQRQGLLRFGFGHLQPVRNLAL